MSGRRKILAALISVVAVVAVGVSAYLTWVIWQSGSVAGCTAESLLDCNDVLTSRWSKWFGLPVSLLGGLTYLAILALCWPAARHPLGLAMPGLFGLAMLAAGSAIWFVGLQAIQLQSFCFYCLTVHSCGLIVGVLTLLLFTGSNSGNENYDQMRSLLGVAAVDPAEDMAETPAGNSGYRLLAAISFSAVGLAVLMGGQLLSESTDEMLMEEIQPITIEASEDLFAEDAQVAIATDQPKDDEDGKSPVSSAEQLPKTSMSLLGAGPRQISFQTLPNTVDVNAFPVMGNTEAPHIMLEMMDYTCGHCRKLHPHLQATLQRYGDQLGIIIYHIPLSKKCNQFVSKDYPGKKYACDYARLAISVWKLAPEKFPEFHDWLLESEKPPSVSKARNRALSLVGDSVLLDKNLKADTTKRLARQATLFKQFKSGLPLLVLKTSALRGVPKDTQLLFDHLESKLGIESQQTTE